MGLFILATPALMPTEAAPVYGQEPVRTHTGLFIQRANKDIVFPSYRADGLILMVGQGFKDWLAPRIPHSPCQKLRPTPHGVDLSDISGTTKGSNGNKQRRHQRGWYGRMFQLPDEV
jgi:TPP-dependent pyruvate/acetoin dehydrogenase alpha subunit